MGDVVGSRCCGLKVELTFPVWNVGPQRFVFRVDVGERFFEGVQQYLAREFQYERYGIEVFDDAKLFDEAEPLLLRREGRAQEAESLRLVGRVAHR